MKNIIRNLIVTVAFLFSGASYAGATAGTDYTLLNPAQPVSTSKIEVLEFFFYGCSHCFHLHGPLSTWEKTMPADVELTYVPVVFRDTWEPMAYTFYALQSMGQLHKYHDALFNAWNVDNIDLHDQSRILDFLGSRGIDRNKFSSAYSSFSVNSQVIRSKQMIRSYGIQGTPTLVVDGRYVITGLQPDQTIRVLNELIAKVRATRPVESKSTKAKAKH